MKAYSNSGSRRGIVALTLLLTAAILVSCFCACDYHPTPFEDVSSYTDIKEAFGSDAGLVFPELSKLGFSDPVDMYQIAYAGTKHDDPQSYIVSDAVSCTGGYMDVRFDCIKDGRSHSAVSNPVPYNDSISINSFVTDNENNKYIEQCWVVVNGDEYSVTSTFHRVADGDAVTDEELSAVFDAQHEKMIEFLRYVADESLKTSK